MSGISRLAPNLLGFTQAVLLLLWSWTAYAQEFNVNTTADTIDKDVADGICADLDDKCSLRAAVMQANQLAGEDHVIYLPAGVYTLSLKGPPEHYAITGDLDVRGNITITSKERDPTKTIVDGGGIDRVFEVVGNAHVTFRFITIRNGNARNNSFNFANGGGIGVTGSGMSVNGPTSSVLVEHCIIRDNRAASGGGIDITNSMATIRNTAIINNSAQDSGGGVNAGLAGSVFIANSTISGNKANHSGGGVQTSNLGITLNNVTITANIADADNDGVGAGGGIATYYNLGNSASNTLIAGNTDLSGAAPDCSVIGFTSLGYNLICNATGCVFNPTESDQVGTPSNPLNPLLGPLANNGGPTFTHALLPNSPAIDAGSPSPPGSGGGACEATDQRGVSRLGRGRCDIGAFESNSPGDTSTGTENNSGNAADTFAGEPGTSGADTKLPEHQEHQAQPPETAARAGLGKPHLPSGREGEREQATADGGLIEGGDDTSLWQSVRAMNYDDEWVNLQKTSAGQSGPMTNAAIVGVGAVFIAGFVHLYIQSGGLLGLIFSFPFWGSIDPIPVILLSKREQKRREKNAEEDRKKENSDRRIGRLLDDE